MKNIRSNCMTKPPWACLGGERMGARGWVSWNVGSRGEGTGSVNSEVKRVLVGGAPDLKGADKQSSIALSL